MKAIVLSVIVATIIIFNSNGSNNTVYARPRLFYYGGNNCANGSCANGSYQIVAPNISSTPTVAPTPESSKKDISRANTNVYKTPTIINPSNGNVNSNSINYSGNYNSYNTQGRVGPVRKFIKKILHRP